MKTRNIYKMNMPFLLKTHIDFICKNVNIKVD